jgi:hypothetical protein
LIPLQTRRKIVTKKNTSDQHSYEAEETERKKRKESDTVSGEGSTNGRERERRGSERERGRETAAEVTIRPTQKLRNSRWESQEEEEQAEEKATMEEKEEEANEQEKAEVTGRVTRGLLPTMSSRLMTKLLDTECDSFHLKPALSRHSLGSGSEAKYSQRRPMRPTKKINWRGSREAECIPSTVRFEAAI